MQNNQVTVSRVFINILWTVILKKKTYLNHVGLGHNLTKELLTLNNQTISYKYKKNVFIKTEVVRST